MSKRGINQYWMMRCACVRTYRRLSKAKQSKAQRNVSSKFYPYLDSWWWAYREDENRNETRQNATQHEDGWYEEWVCKQHSLLDVCRCVLSVCMFACYVGAGVTCFYCCGFGGYVWLIGAVNERWTWDWVLFAWYRWWVWGRVAGRDMTVVNSCESLFLLCAL